jgi:hypothetical protein
VLGNIYRENWLEVETRYDKNYTEGASFKLTMPLSKLYIFRRRLNAFHSSLSILVVRIGGSVTAIETRAESIKCYEDSQEG